APGIAGCTALRLPGGTRTAAWPAEAVTARSRPRKRERNRLMRRPVLVGRKLCRARSRVETCRAYRGESPAGASLAPQSAPSSHVELRLRCNCRLPILQDEARQVGVLRQVANMFLDVIGVDPDRRAAAVRRVEGNIVQHPFHHRLQAARANI